MSTESAEHGLLIGLHHCCDMPDSRELISKRLHISGLTAALSSHDLERRLAAFGTVIALDGFGKLDAVGQPRKFAYVTLETTKSQLSRCMWYQPFRSIGLIFR